MNPVNIVHDSFVHSRRVEVLGQRLGGMLREAMCDWGATRATVLDVGAGDGRVAATIARYCEGARFTGVDVLVREQAVIPVIAYDGSRLPFEDGHFDVVTLVDVLHHTDDAPAVLRECARVARRCVLVKDHVAQGPLDHATLRLMDHVGNKHHGVRLPYRYLSARQWEDAIAAAGLETARWQRKLDLYAGPLNWCFGRGLHFVARLNRSPQAIARAA